MHDQNRLTVASAQKAIIDRTPGLNGIGLILPAMMAQANKAKVVAKNRSVKSIGKPRSSGRFLYRPANRNSRKLASMETRSARHGKNRHDRSFSATPTGRARGDAPMPFSTAPALNGASSANMQKLHRAPSRGPAKP